MAAGDDVPPLGTHYDSMDDDDDEDDDEACWNEMDAESENHMTCLFCTQNFKTMAVALEHCKTDHNFNLLNLKSKHNMDCYSYICMVNYVRKEGISPDVILNSKEPPWLSESYLAPVINDDPWLMFDFEGLETPSESRVMTPDKDYHIVNSENGLVTLTEQHFAQLQHTIKYLTCQIREKEEALSLAAEQITQMRVVTQSLVCSDINEKDLESTVKRMNINDDDGYFSTYSHFGIHHEMLSDKVRTESYRNAIVENPSVISNKIILDVGCGTGILSMFAATTGASKVFGIDQSEIIFHANDIVCENNLTDKIDLIHGKVENGLLAVDKVDVIISEWMGYFLLFEGMLDSVIWARDKYLNQGGVLMPNRCSIHLVGLSDPENYQEMLGFWSDVYGFKMTCLAKEVIREALVSSVTANKVATSHAQVLNLDLYTADVSSTNFSSDFTLESNIDGFITALCGYFDTFFDLPNPVVLSTSPEKQSTHWRQTVFYLPNPIQVKKGDVLNGHIDCKKKPEDNRALIITIIISGQRNTYVLA